jgi:glycosyltransferase involved in cell wall biosynthesis
MPATISAIVITKNEAENIEDCLNSLSFANEIIVYDSGSDDNTVQLAEQFTKNIFVTDWPGDGPQKNRALSKATSDWVICLDADERVSQELANEIKLNINNTNKSGFILPFQSFYCGKAIRFGDWRNESHLRLFKRTGSKFTEDEVHCHCKVDGQIGKLKHFVYHYPFRRLDKMLLKLNEYSSKSAQAKFSNNKKSSLFTALTHGIWTFLRGYFIKLGFLDGREGFILAVSNAEGTYYRYLKLMYLQKAHE